MRCTHIFSSIILASKTSPASPLITQQLISKLSLLLTIKCLSFASPSFVGAMDGDEDACGERHGTAQAWDEQCGQGPGMPLLPSLNRELRRKDQNTVSVSKGVKRRGHRHRKWCASGVSQTLLSREEVGTPSSCTGRTQHEKLLGDF